MKNIRSSQPCISMNFCTELQKFFHVTAYYFCNKSSIIHVRLVIYIDFRRSRNFQNEAKVEQIIALVTTRSVSCYGSENYLQFRKKKHLLMKIFGSPYTSNQIYLRLNCFSNYIYLKDIYLTLKEIGKIMFASVLKILLICKFLNFAAFFTKGKN